MNRRKNLPSSASTSSPEVQKAFGSIKASPKHHYLFIHHWIIYIAAVASLCYFAHWCHHRLPEPLNPNHDNTRFSEKRVSPILHKLSDLGPKPYGAQAADDAVIMIQEEVKILKKFVEKGPNKLDIEMQFPSSCFSVPKFDVDGFGMCYKNVSNLIVRLTPKQRLSSKTKDEGALLLNCHFDSWPTSPAGSDDLASCVILLELIHILGDPKAEPLKHDLIFLFNGAEEAGLLASHGFITQHNERHRIKGFVNLEASGSGGREILFQSGPFSQWMLDAYLRAAPYPHVSVIGQEVFQSGIVPSDTDFRIFRDHGKISGLDFAFAQNAYWWHTEFDEAKRITPGSIQRAGENVLATLRYLLSQDSFEAADQPGSKYFVFFDFLGFTTISYSYLSAWILNIATGMAVFVTIQKHSKSFTIFGTIPQGTYWKYLIQAYIFYIVAYAVIGFVMKLAISFIGNVADGKLLWLTRHSNVFPLMVFPVAFLAFTVFSFVIVNFARDPNHSIMLAWSLYDIHNLIILGALWVVTIANSAAGFLFLVMLIPTMVDAFIRSFHFSLAHTFSSRYHMFVILPTFLAGIMTLYYKLEITLSTFIPILGRSKGDTDFLVLIVCLAGVFLTFFATIPLIAFTNKKSLHNIRLFGGIIVAGFLVYTVIVATPYRYNDKFPTTRRTQFYHVRNRVLGPSSEVLEENQELLAIAQDNRKVYDIPFVGNDPEFKEIDCSGKGRYCNLPFFFPTPDRLGPNMIRRKVISDDSMEFHEASVEVVKKALDAQGNLRYRLRVTGSDQISVIAEPPSTATCLRWRLIDSPDSEFVSNSSFIFLSCGGENCGHWDLEIVFESMKPTETVEVMVASHTLHGPKMYSRTLKKMHEDIRKNRETGDWRWAMTASSWTVDFLRGFSAASYYVINPKGLYTVMYSTTAQVAIQSVVRWMSIIGSVLASWIMGLFEREPEAVHLEGFVEPGFEKIKEAFRLNLSSGWEHEGASLTVYHQGKLVADLWGGYSDKESRRLWRQDTVSVAFSSTKAVASLCIASLVDKGLITYDSKICQFWPAFGKHGKSSVTLQWVLSHLSGLAYFDAEITEEDARDWKRMAKLIENEVPKWEPGTAVGYHAITFGWLVDQIVRRVDPDGRSMAQYFKDEIQGGSDFHIGLAPAEAYRVARIKLPSIWQRLSEYWTNPKAVDYPRFLYDFATDGILSKCEKNPKWFRFVKEMTLNNPDYYTLEQSAVMGIGNGRSLAEIFNRAIFTGAIFKNPSTIKKLTTPFIRKEDIVTGALVARGQGLMFSPFVHPSGKLYKMIGHAGYGGQNIKFDLENQLCFGYVSNGLKAGFGDSARTFVRLRDAIYSCIDTHQN